MVQFRDQGGSSVGLHMIHSESKHYFKRAIMISGVAINGILLTEDDQTEYMRNHFDVDNSNIVQALNEIDGMDLCEKICQRQIYSDPGTMVPNNIFSVVVEGIHCNYS